MKRISSNYTLALKVFLPTFWMVFFGMFGIAIWIAEPETNLLISSTPFRITYMVFFTLFSALFYFTFIQLKRVDHDETGLYISNYFKTYKYSFDSIRSVEENDYLVFKTINFILHRHGNFGKNIRFIPSKANYKAFKEKKYIATDIEADPN